jgi:opacity protein-like surface antigen
MLLLSSPWAVSQVVAAADRGLPLLSAGAYYSYFDANYQGIRPSGIGAYVDVSPLFINNFGAEAEGRWLTFNAPNDFSEYTYLAGPRYRFPIRPRLQIYAKMLFGAGEINFPYHLAHGSYFAMAPGGGVDYVLNRRWRVRADYEYQFWPNAPGIPGEPSSTLRPNGVSAGISYQIFQRLREVEP